MQYKIFINYIKIYFHIVYLRAKSLQTFKLKTMEEKDKEIGIVMTARNHKNNHKPKNCDIITYKYATGFEALIGYLYLNNDIKRIEEIIDFIVRR